MEFLLASKQLLYKSRRVLISDTSSLDPSSFTNSGDNTPRISIGSNSGANAGGGNPGTGAGGAAGNNASIASNPTLEQNYIKWQNEMERGYEILLNAILPFISDTPYVDELTAGAHRHLTAIASGISYNVTNNVSGYNILSSAAAASVNAAPAATPSTPAVVSTDAA